MDIGAFQISLVVESNSGTVVTTAAGLTLPGAVSLADSYAGTAISFDPSVFNTVLTITLTGTQLTLSNTSLTTSITGPAVGVTVSGGGASRVFQISTSVTASFSDLTISGGSAAIGGGLFAEESATVRLTDCTFSGNSAANYGGGLNNWPNATVRLTDCTFSGNTAAINGGGLDNYNGATATLTDCTFSGNSAANYGGAMDCGGTPTLTNVTVSGNTANEGGGVYKVTGGGTFTLGNTIVAGNTASTDPDAVGSFTSQGHNLIGNTSGNSGWVGTDKTGREARISGPWASTAGRLRPSRFSRQPRHRRGRGP